MKRKLVEFAISCVIVAVSVTLAIWFTGGFTGHDELGDVHIVTAKAPPCPASGTVKNVEGDYVAKDVWVFVEFLDARGDQVGSTRSYYVGQLGPGETATFAVTPEPPYRCPPGEYWEVLREVLRDGNEHIVVRYKIWVEWRHADENIVRGPPREWTFKWKEGWELR